MADLSNDAPNILVLADSGAHRVGAVLAMQALGARPSEPVALDDALAALGELSGYDAIFVELGDVHPAANNHLLSRICQLSVERAMPVVVCCTFEAIDRVEGLLGGSPVTLLVDPDEADRVAALTVALHDRDASRVREIDPVRLRRLADEVSRIARALSSLSAQASPASQGYSSAPLAESKAGFSAEPADPTALPLPSADMVRKIIRTRRLRDSFFEPSLFADPAWDMLLDLLAAQIEGDRVAVSSLCIAAAVPPTTALRWIKTLSEDGLIVRHADPEDGRRAYLGLSQGATIALARYFEAVARFEGVAI